MEKELVKGIAIIRRSENRKKILTYLKNGMAITSNIAKETNMKNSHVSKYLKSMKETELIVCLNEEDTQGRLHKITPFGKKSARIHGKIKNKKIYLLHQLIKIYQ